MSKNQGKKCNQKQARGLISDSPKKNHFYALKSTVIKRIFLIMLQVFSINFYALLDPVVS